MQGFPPKEVAAYKSKRVVCIVKTGELRAKAFQVGFERDGSIFIHFPYFRNRVGILSCSEIPATGERTADVCPEVGGKVTSHLVKYSHHPDGRAHFSQDGKIFTAIKRQAMPLDSVNGHLFTLSIQGPQGLVLAAGQRDTAAVSLERAVFDFPIAQGACALKFVGRWLAVAAMRCNGPEATVGPKQSMVEPDGVNSEVILFASPHVEATHLLAISCFEIPKLGPESEIFVFCGGFDSHETMTNVTKKAGFLSFIYPLTQPDAVRQRVGSVDYVPKSER